MEWYGYVLLVAGLLIVAFIFFLIGMLYRKKVAEREIGSAETEATRIINEAIKGGENKKREMLVEAKEEIHKSRTEYEKEVKERRADLQKQERRLQQKEESLDKKLDAFERKEDDLRRRQANIAATQDEVEMIKKSQLETLEKLSGLTQEEAKNHLLKNLENECKHDAALKIKEIETNLKDNADQLAREIISIAIQRCAADHAAETTVSVVALPNDEMKGPHTAARPQPPHARGHHRRRSHHRRHAGSHYGVLLRAGAPRDCPPGSGKADCRRPHSSHPH